MVAGLGAGRGVDAFAPNSLVHSSLSPGSILAQTPTIVRTATSVTSTNDCGCADPIISGAPSDIAQLTDPREALRGKSLRSISTGEPVAVDDLLGEQKVSIVVFLRSLG